jgi:hypothetical protein
MTIVANTFLTFDAKGLREELSNVIYNISPEDTPFMSGAGKEDVSQTLYEWQTDALAAAISTNAALQGDDIASFPAVTPTVRVGNYTQISRKLLVLSGTLEAVNKAGRRSEFAYQMSKRSAELKRDMEKTMLENIGAVAGNSTTAPLTATLGAWVKSNVSTGSGGGNPAYTSGVPGAARTDGTTRQYSETILKTVAQSVWAAGGTLKVHMLGPETKVLASTFTGIAANTYNINSAKPATIIGAADVYVSNFGVLRLVPNRFQRERDGWFIDFEYVSVAYLRSFNTEPLAKTGDARKAMLLVEWGLKVKQEAALGLAADLKTTA